MLRMVFDVESVGLFGEGFAVGYVVVQGGKELASGCWACDPHLAHGTKENLAWVLENVRIAEYNCESTVEVREKFWADWMLLKSAGCELWADCAWPVEANFLLACVNDDLVAREWLGPYPLFEIASVISVAGESPLEPRDRLDSELPIHNPLADARQSARVLLDVLHPLYELAGVDFVEGSITN